MLDGHVALLEHALARVALEPTVPPRTGAHHATLAPFGAFRASDGDLVIAALVAGPAVKYSKSIALE